MTGALAPPQLRMIKPIRGPFQKTLWEVALSLGRIQVWKGNNSQKGINQIDFQFQKTKMFYLRACLKTSFVF